MRLSDFILLSEEEKAHTILHQGVLLAKREFNRLKIFLFKLGSYYVEMVCNPLNKVVEEYRAFHGTKLLSPYLHTISINDLLR